MQCLKPGRAQSQILLLFNWYHLKKCYATTRTLIASYFCRDWSEKHENQTEGRWAVEERSPEHLRGFRTTFSCTDSQDMQIKNQQKKMKVLFRPPRRHTFGSVVAARLGDGEAWTALCEQGARGYINRSAFRKRFGGVYEEHFVQLLRPSNSPCRERKTTQHLCDSRHTITYNGGKMEQPTFVSAGQCATEYRSREAASSLCADGAC